MRWHAGILLGSAFWIGTYEKKGRKQDWVEEQIRLWCSHEVTLCGTAKLRWLFRVVLSWEPGLYSLASDPSFDVSHIEEV